MCTKPTPPAHTDTNTPTHLALLQLLLAPHIRPLIQLLVLVEEGHTVSLAAVARQCRGDGAEFLRVLQEQVHEHLALGLAPLLAALPFLQLQACTQSGVDKGFGVDACIPLLVCAPLLAALLRHQLQASTQSGVD